jgi:hypothetical protein
MLDPTAGVEKNRMALQTHALGLKPFEIVRRELPEKKV